MNTIYEVRWLWLKIVQIYFRKITTYGFPYRTKMSHIE